MLNQYFLRQAKSHNILIFIAFFLLCALLIQAREVQASDCSQSKSLFREARNTENLDSRIKLLEQAVNLCPSFKILLLKADTHERMGQWKQAKEAYHGALNKTNKEKKVEYLEGKIAYTLYKSGNACDADIFFQVLKNKHETIPDWVLETYQKYSEEKSRQMTSADDIACGLDMNKFKSLGVATRRCPTVSLKINFAYDSDKIEGSSYRQLRELNKALQRPGSSKYGYKLIGHTDKRGDAAYNLGLSERRAKSVKRLLLDLDYELGSRLTALGRGENDLLSGGNSSSDHQLNRRVEVEVKCK
jgi:outer membrane protein OmpA-like peptidoglycan-associated protein